MGGGGRLLVVHLRGWFLRRPTSGRSGPQQPRPSLTSSATPEPKLAARAEGASAAARQFAAAGTAW